MKLAIVVAHHGVTTNGRFRRGTGVTLKYADPFISCGRLVSGLAGRRFRSDWALADARILEHFESQIDDVAGLKWYQLDR